MLVLVILKKKKILLMKKIWLLTRMHWLKKKRKKKKKKKKKKKEKKEKKEKKKKKKKKKKDAEEQQINEADLIGLEDESGFNNSIREKDKPTNLNNDIFAIFNSPNIINNPNSNTTNTSINITNTNDTKNTSNTNNVNNTNNNNNNPLETFDFFGTTNTEKKNNNTNPNLPENIFQNVDKFPTTKVSESYNNNNLLIASQLQRTNGKLQLGLYFSQGGKSCQLSFNKNSFGLLCQPNSKIKNNNAFFSVDISSSNSDGKPPINPFVVNGVVTYNKEKINIQIEINIFILFIENSKLIGNPFLEFYSQNRNHDFNAEIFSYPKYNNEEEVKTIFEKKNIIFSAKQTKINPPVTYYSANILGKMPFLIESFINKNNELNLKIIANNTNVIPLIKGAIDSILG